MSKSIIKPEHVQKITNRISGFVATVKAELVKRQVIELTKHGNDTKLAGIESVNTSCAMNARCLKRMLSGDSNCVCTHCYSVGYQNMRPNLVNRLVRNAYRLCGRDIADYQIPRFSTVLGRIESFGDTADEKHAHNYIRIIRANPQTRFAVFTKNPMDYVVWFEREGKPGNMAFVVSSMYLDKPVQLDKRIAKWTDHIFTVSAIHDKNSPLVNCGGRCCQECKRCFIRMGEEGHELYVLESVK